MSLDDPNSPDIDRDRASGGRKPSFGKSFTIIVILAALVAGVALFVSNRSDPSRENDPHTTAPTTRP
ncbi:hypothetical protein ACFQI3_15510 [Hansschlegelia quercus]|uniref:Uncharacterized protein n=1 Tax=Hansschlegelia quercus TaxID=2528245 RepID=A0A4V2JDD4_9HYPH|nr:hypothetical protein [Hansschlegelia quercus]TBN48255.1 hypothetical protein EYR15_14355 [Hansschlegelia quercus]